MTTPLSEAINKMRADYCEGCREKYSEEEIMSGKQCAACEEAAEAGRMVADLQD